MADLFVSYKHDDRPVVEQIVARLANEGYSVWWDSRLEAGDNFGEEIAREIDKARCVVVVWSQASVHSKWVYAEATEADSQRKLVPVIIEPCRIKPPFNIVHSYFLDGAMERETPAWTALLSRVRSFVSSAPGATSEDRLPTAPTNGAAPPDVDFLDFVRIPGGTCEHKEEEGATATIAIGYAFAIGRVTVTVAEWNAAIAEGFTVSPAREDTQENGQLPVVNVSWDDAAHYAAWLSERTGKRIRLPSEAEWEYACRAKGSGAFSCGDRLDQKQACCRVASARGRALPDGPAPVGSFPPNAFGLHDMHGNVWEWTSDCWRPSLAGLELDGSPMLDGDRETRVIRGGSWAHPCESAGCSARGHARKASRNLFTGFRLVMECDEIE